MIEFEIDGRKRGFNFGTYTFKLINKIAGKELTIEQVFEGLEENKKENGPTILEKIDFRRMFLQACAQHYCLSTRQEIDFTEVDISDWMDELGAEKVNEQMTELLRFYIDKALKNAQALEAGQLQSTNGKH
jgi:hypothetical protein